MLILLTTVEHTGLQFFVWGFVVVHFFFEKSLTIVVLEPLRSFHSSICP